MRTRTLEDPKLRTSVNDTIMRIEDDLPIDLESVDYTFKNPKLVAERYGFAFPYFARVEREVEGTARQIQAMVPRSDPAYQEFLPPWDAQEVHHGLILERAVQELGLDLDEPNLDGPTPQQRLIGIFASIKYLGDPLEVGIETIGALHERSTLNGYLRFERGLLDIGEEAIVETGIRPIKRQEGPHFNFYKGIVELKRPTLTPLQKNIANYVIQLGYTPVGANSPLQKAQFSKAISQLGNKSETRQVRDKLIELHTKFTDDVDISDSATLLALVSVKQQIIRFRQTIKKDISDGLKVTQSEVNRIDEVFDECDQLADEMFPKAA